MQSVRRPVALVVALLGIGACAHGGGAPPVEEGPSAYLIGLEDVLDVSIWRDADLSRVVPVRPDGRISLPLVGELQAAGRTPDQVAEEIRSRLQPLIEDPRVVVIVREINAPRFFVIGEVVRPGGYPLRNRTTVLQALSLAGGPNEFASRGGIVVLRGGKQRIRVNYRDLVDQPASRDFALQPGDTIVVP
ncbi:MAG: polysaccharide biosynthesis/export family protein [Deltaproteobacteria bacterium]|nr:polysaccharide biosynthesis/export family protein [Deltaproteobacteria bacterium]